MIAAFLVLKRLGSEASGAEGSSRTFLYISRCVQSSDSRWSGLVFRRSIVSLPTIKWQSEWQTNKMKMHRRHAKVLEPAIVTKWSFLAKKEIRQENTWFCRNRMAISDEFLYYTLFALSFAQGTLNSHFIRVIGQSVNQQRKSRIKKKEPTYFCAPRSHWQMCLPYKQKLLLFWL